MHSSKLLENLDEHFHIDPDTKSSGLEDEFPLQIGDFHIFSWSMFIYQRVISTTNPIVIGVKQKLNTSYQHFAVAYLR